jgi:hypothetical protein
MIFYYDTLPLYHNDVNKKNGVSSCNPVLERVGGIKKSCNSSKFEKFFKNYPDLDKKSQVITQVNKIKMSTFMQPTTERVGG